MAKRESVMMLRMMKYVTVSGLIATHKKVPFYGTIWIDKKTGLITKVVKGKDPKADYVYGDEFLIFAGFSDIHIHAREDESALQCYKEDYGTASEAALHGGVVCACAMPNTPETVVTLKRFNWHRGRVKQIDHPVAMLNYLGIDKNTRPIGKPGEYMYKLYFGKSVGDLTVMYGEELDLILSRYRGHHVSFHVEYEPVVQASATGNTHAERRPVAAVNEGLMILLPLIKKYKIKAKLCHWSTGGTSFEMIADYRKQGCDIVLEVSPLHLMFDTSMTDKDPELWTKIQMNPAIQAPEHRKALIKGLKDGFIQFIATDHAPHTEEEKFSAFAIFREDGTPEKIFATRQGIDVANMSNKAIAAAVKQFDEALFLKTCIRNNHSGAPWLDTYGLVCTWLMKVHKFTPQDIARVSAYLPGRFVNRYLKTQFKKQNFGKGFGEIETGFMGSLTVLNTKSKTLVRRADLHTKVRWSALEGMTLPGAVEAVFIRGTRY